MTGATCANCLKDKPETEAFEDEFCSQECFDEWWDYQSECAEYEAMRSDHEGAAL